MTVNVLVGDCRETLRALEAQSVQTCVTSPPYWGLRDYGVASQIGLEKTPDEYVHELVAVFREVRRVLKDDGTLWLNLGDSYNAAGREGHGTRNGFKQGTNRASASGADGCRPTAANLKPKDLVGIPWMVAFALRADGWYLRSDVIWAKPNPMPESVTDRPTKAHEYVFLLSKSERYHYDARAIAEPAQIGARKFNGAHSGNDDRQDNGRQDRSGIDNRNKRTVWTIASEPCAEAHFAVMPSALVVPCILAGSRIGDTVLDPFGGSGTTARVAEELGRNAVLCELNQEYAKIIGARTAQPGLFAKA